MGDVTTSVVDTVQAELDKADPNTLADVLRLVKLGTMVTPLKRTFTGLTSATAFDLTAIDGTGETAGATNPARLALLDCRTLRVTAGAATAGPRTLTDSGGTAGAPGANGPGVVVISDDGKTLTFEAGVTGFVIEYVPRAATNMTAQWAGQE